MSYPQIYKNLVYQGTMGVYYEIDEELLGIAKEIQFYELENTLYFLGFRPIGKLVCSLVEQTFIHEYGQPHGITFASLMTQLFESSILVVGVDFYTVFEDGSSLTSTFTSNVTDIKEKNIFRRFYSGISLAELYSCHFQDIIDFTKLHGKAIPIGNSLLSVAISIDSFLIRQFG